MGSTKKTTKQPPPAAAGRRAVTTAELINGAEELRHRLNRHLDALEAREPGAVADLAAVLRTLLVRGDGDDVIRRLCSATHTPLPEVLVTSPAADGKNVVLSVGAVSTSPQDETLLAAGDPRPTHLVNLSRWMDMRALVIRGGRPRRANNWDDVIKMYANTQASHLSSTIPEALSQISQIMSGGLDLGQYLIHCAGIAAETALNQVLGAVSGEQLIQPHKVGRQLNPLVGLVLSSDTGAGPSVQPYIFGAHLPVEKEVDVLKLHYGDRYIKASYTLRTDGKVDGVLKWADQKASVVGTTIALFHQA